MEMNAGAIDRLIRIFIGTTLLYLTFTNVIGSWGYFGVVGILTGLSGMCLLYLPFGLNTCKFDQKSNHH